MRNMVFGITPRRRRSYRSGNKHATPSQCGYETGGMHIQRRGGRRNDCCPE